MTRPSQIANHRGSIEVTSRRLLALAVVIAICSACSVPEGSFETPDLVQRAYVKPSHVRPSDQFGHSIALSGDGSTLAVGATGDSSDDPANPSSAGSTDSGAVHVFRRAETTWIFETYLKASQIKTGAGFGYSVALSRDGSTLAVGAYNESRADCDEEVTGAAYLFTRENGLWREQKRFALAGVPCNNDKFGASVALSDDGATFAVGIPGDKYGPDASDDEPQDQGKVHVYVRDAVGWSKPAIEVKVPNYSAPTGDKLGASVALSGDGSLLVIGAPYDGARSAHAGAVYVSTRSAWTALTRLEAPHSDMSDEFGSRVAISRDGTTLVASAQLEDGSGAEPNDNLVAQSGAAYVFKRSGSTWSLPFYVKPAHPGELDHFGSSLAVSQDGERVTVGAYDEDSASKGIDQDEIDNGRQDAGAAFVFASDGGSYGQAAYLKASNTDRAERFGNSIAMSGDGSIVAVGAFHEGGSSTGVNPAAQTKDGMKQGAVYVFHRLP